MNDGVLILTVSILSITSIRITVIIRNTVIEVAKIKLKQAIAVDRFSDPGEFILK
jgi:hypothetical protein